MPKQPTRDIVTPTVSRFRGINKYLNKAVMPPDYAQDLLNVVVNSSGVLTKLRVPVGVSAIEPSGSVCNGYFDFQRADGLRHVICVWGTKIYHYDWDQYGDLVPTLIDDNPGNNARWSFVSSNQVLYMANGIRMLKWNGVNLWNWGIVKPPAPPLVEATGTGLMASGSVRQWKRVAGVTTYYMTTVGSLIAGAEVTITRPDDPTTDLRDNETFDGWVGGAPAWVSDPDFAVVDATVVSVNKDSNFITISQPGKPDVALTDVPDGDYDAMITVHISRSLGNGETYDMDIPTTRTFLISARWYGTPADPMPNRTYVVSFGNSVLGCEGPGSDISISVGNSTHPTLISLENSNKQAILADPQIDMLYLWTTRSGGTDYYLHTEYPLTRNEDGSITFPEIWDQLTDDALNTIRQCPFYNFPPPVGKYLAEWGGRIYIAGLAGAKSDIVYSGYERIPEGRPEDAFPPGNRIRLATGADEVRGIGVIQAGVIAFSKSNEMFIFRGVPEDATGEEPMAYSAILDKLPWQKALLSHWTIESTPQGLEWLSSCRSIDQYNGSGGPVDLSLAIAPILRDLTPGTEELPIATYYSHADRDWYMVALTAGGSQQLNRILVVDLKDGDDNCGIFVFDIGAFDYLDYIEDPTTGIPRVFVAQAGQLKEVKLIDSTEGGYHTSLESSNKQLDGYWKGGYYGNDNPGVMKTARKLFHEADRPGWKVEVDVVDGNKYTIADPQVIELEPQGNSRQVSINRKFRRLAVKIVMPKDDVDISVTQQTLQVIPTSTR